MMRAHCLSYIPWLALVLGVITPATAHADAVVHVKVRTPEGEPADGRVVLEPENGEDDDGETYACTTDNGTCTVRGVPGGRYVVRLEPKQGDPPEPERAMIPPSGEVDLVISTQ